MVVVEYEKFSKGRVRTHELQVDLAKTIHVEGGALILKNRSGTVVCVFAEGHWSNATFLEEVVVKNLAGDTLIKERLDAA